MLWVGVLVVIVLFFGFMIAAFNSQRRSGKLKLLSQVSLSTNSLSDRQIQEELLKASWRIEKHLNTIGLGVWLFFICVVGPTVLPPLMKFIFDKIELILAN